MIPANGAPHDLDACDLLRSFVGAASVLHSYFHASRHEKGLTPTRFVSSVWLLDYRRLRNLPALLGVAPMLRLLNAP
jgi:hypothetical protein